MAKTDELTIEVKLNVPDEMAAASVVILNLYLKDNYTMDVMVEKVDGHYQIHLENNATAE